MYIDHLIIKQFSCETSLEHNLVTPSVLFSNKKCYRANPSAHGTIRPAYE